MDQTQWYQLDQHQTAAQLRTDLDHGLSEAEVKNRQAEYGPNELAEEAGKSIWQMLFEQFKDFLVILLLIAALISGFLGEWLDSAVIMVIVILNAFLGVFQEFRAEKSLAALKKLSAPLARVLRDGQIKEIPARELVPGDIFFIEAGGFVPADARLFEAINLHVDEAALTGESVPAEKSADTLHEELPLADRRNLVFMSTVVTYGRAKGIVIKTGMHTEIGQIAKMIQQVVPESTPLQEKLAEFGKYLGVMALVVCTVIFVVGWLRGENPITMFLTAVSLAVAAIPEGLPAIVTIVLALGVQRMAKHRAIIRKLPAVETLGAATVICSDKTGTLTQNQMTVRRAFVTETMVEVTGEGYQPSGQFLVAGTPQSSSNESLNLLLLCGALCNDALLVEDKESDKISWRIVGDPTEGALVVAAAKAGLNKDSLSQSLERVLEIPFDSDRKLMTTIHKGSLLHNTLRQFEKEEPHGLWAITKGAPDIVLNRCTNYLSENGIRPLTTAEKENLLKTNGDLACEALRVLAVAVRRVPEAEKIKLDQVESQLTFVGFWGMIDPPRSEARTAIAECRHAGIKPVMITGDHRDTAVAVAKELGLMEEGDLVMSGQELNATGDQDLKTKVEYVAVYARVSPEHKVRIVNALRERGHVVAMTGDGVNDAPALKRADIGAAMGITGTDVAKSAADMVLADDNFATIVGAVKEGRIIFENIKKAIYFLLSCNIGEIITIFLAILLQYPVPLFAIQILWINLVTDSLPALALGMEPAEPNIMNRKPRRKDQGIFTSGMKETIFIEGVLIGAFSLLAFTIGRAFGGSVEQARTMTFATLSLSQLFHVFNFRSIKDSIFKKGLTPNYYLFGAALVSAGIQLIVMFVPFLQPIFKVVPLDPLHWFYVGALSVAMIPVAEIWKATYLKRFRREEN